MNFIIFFSFYLPSNTKRAVPHHEAARIAISITEILKITSFAYKANKNIYTL
ncbi:hypothetical protein TPHV1_100082 [Treponema phagedenis]|uniref:Uncharacterized protein n=1 Tax=Treponema phagedenis TaxID=162 RepID=A0A0B7GTB0_TREPH|nr:hypothetical protein TPHV1_100082 [Treponema phagedenis]